MFIKNYWSSILLFFTVLTVNAQYTEVINSNRPGVSRSAFSVGTNVVQFEVGPYSINEEHTPLKFEVAGFGIDFSARYGFLFPQLELNLEGTYQNDTRTDFRSTIVSEFDRANFKHVTIGAKYLVYDPYKNKEDKPNLYSYHANRRFKWSSLIPAASVYVGGNYDTKNNPYTAPGIEGFSPKVMISTQNNFASGWVLVMNFIKDRIGSEYSDFQYIVTLTKAINQQLVLFGETQGIQSDFYADNLFRFGGAYLINKNFQLDTGLTFNTKDTPSVFSVNFGASYRLDFHKDPEIDNGNAVEDLAGGSKSNKKGKKKKKKKNIDTPENDTKRKKETEDIDFDDED